MFLTYKYRLLPTKKQHEQLNEILESQRELYNAALQERIDCYNKTAKSLSYIDQCKSISKWRQIDVIAQQIPANLQRWSIKKLDNAFQKFFKNLKANKKVGFPRFKSKNRWRSFGFNEFSGIRFDSKRLKFKGLSGSLRVHMHRSLSKDSKICSCTFTKDIKGWYVTFQIKIPDTKKKKIQTKIGIDLGLTNFVTMSDGNVIPNPRIAKRHEKELRRRNRALSRCKKGSKRRQKVKKQLARCYSKIKNTRDTWQHQQSNKLVSNYDLIVIENLNINNIIKQSWFSKSIHDASWSKFIDQLSYKAEKAGKTLVKVNPKNTSQNCSGCGTKVPKTLSERTHNCPNCGLSLDRDLNAAINILNRAVMSPEIHNVTGYSERVSENIIGEIQ